MEKYFKFKWSFDKNNAIAPEEYVKMLDQLPIEIQLNLISDYLYKDFVFQFKRLFEFRMWKSKLSYQYYTFSNL